MNPRLKLLFLGSGEFGLPTLARLAQEHEVVGIVTQPDRPAGRAQRLTPTPIGQWASEHLPRAPILKPESINNRAQLNEISALEPDVAVVIAFGQKLGPTFLVEHFAINLHASLLPRWRGAAPINHAILAGDTETGNSVITLADRMDAGFILAQSRRPIGPATTAGELHDLLAADGPALVLEVIEKHRTGTLQPVAQDAALVTLAPKLSKQDGWVNFTDSAGACARRVNGLSPWPGVTVAFRDSPLRLVRAEPLRADSEEGCKDGPGSIADPDLGAVRCGGGSRLKLLEVQPAGGRVMSWSEFARGRRVIAEERLMGVSPC
ncbi:MAG: methionyl-tRNA formyltransferase [Phycisphaerae bacterium]|nr:methionyl-tRNA formyltransferase [Phycisphaerae bacterium]